MILSYFRSKMILDSLASVTVVLAVLAAVYHSFIIATFAGIFMTQTCVVAHNFFHMRDNWRMYFFNLTLLTVRLVKLVCLFYMIGTIDILIIPPQTLNQSLITTVYIELFNNT